MSKQPVVHNLLCDYLQQLGVPHTTDYSVERFKTMPFKTLFGLSKLLGEYGVKSAGYFMVDKQEIHQLTPPFLAHTPQGIVIVTELDETNVTYLTRGVAKKVPLAKFMQDWDGNVMLSFPDADACEPDYAVHKRIELLMRAKKWVLLGCTVVLFVYLLIAHGIYRHVSTVLVTVCDLLGLYFTYLLVQKSMNIHNPAADKVCGVLQAGGCDDILQTKASKFFGLFGWSEVGFSYFSVSLLTLLLFPDMVAWLALCNVCCLPFTVWSIWYQRFRAHKWCTLCVCVQATLWLLFFSYLSGMWIKDAWPPFNWSLVMLGITYLAVMLALNALMPLIENKNSNT